MAIKGAKKQPVPHYAQTPADRLEGMKKAYELSGSLWALHDALELISHFGRITPDWLLEGATAVVRDRLQHGKTIAKGGPGGNETSKKLQDMKDFHRWQIVKYMVKNGIQETSAFKQAVPRLSAKGDTVSWSTIRDSYKQVEADWADPIKRQRYYSPLFEWLPEAKDDAL